MHIYTSYWFELVSMVPWFIVLSDTVNRNDSQTLIDSFNEIYYTHFVVDWLFYEQILRHIQWKLFRNKNLERNSFKTINHNKYSNYLNNY